MEIIRHFIHENGTLLAALVFVATIVFCAKFDDKLQPRRAPKKSRCPWFNF